ncbi:MAG: hypothetical protein JXA54_15835 [Candidatus Heimdallarchaeota archaeon]|nr:hypothetical protein [Candidatus Heimdallarchaeota archaeon]
MQNDIAFVADLETGLHIVNVSNPEAPELVSHYEMERSHNAFLTEDVAYVLQTVNMVLK